MDNWGIKEWSIISSFIFSLASILIVVFKDFIQGANLKTVLNSIVILKLAEGNKSDIIIDSLVKDFLSENPTKRAVEICNMRQELKSAVESKNRDLIIGELGILVNQLQQSTGQILIYQPSEEVIKSYIGKNVFATTFYVPLNIVNSGRKTGDITSLFMKIKPENSNDKKWIYSCFSEIKPDEFINSSANQPTGKMIGKIFPGISIAPNNNQRIDSFLIPMDTANDKIISNEGLSAGKYQVQIIGYNSKNKKCLESNVATLTLNDVSFIESFNGSNSMRNLSLENHIEKEI